MVTKGSLEGTVALVTGASRGIGAAIVERLHRAGAHVAITARSSDALESLAASLAGGEGTGRVLTLPGSVTDPAAVEEAVAAARDAFGPLDLLINNAGMVESRNVPMWEADPREWWEVTATNLYGPMLMTRAVVPDMLARGSGRIINIVSRRGIWPLPDQTAYGASKCALMKLTESLATSLSGTGVRVFGYSPGRVRTSMTENLTGSKAGSWTPMDLAVDGIMAIAEGRLDALEGRFLHAHDDLSALAAQADEIIKRDGRVFAVTEAFPGDTIGQR